MLKSKKLLLPIIAVCIILLSFIGCTVSDVLTQDKDDLESDVTPVPTPEVSSDPQTNPPEPIIINRRGDGEFRAVWVSTVLNLDFPVKPGMSEAAMKRHIDSIVINTVEMGLNAIILQVRPAGDAFYESDIFPWSYWLSGTQGVAVPGFDPLEYWIDICHENNIELHAWLNPYRIIHTRTNSSDPNTLAANNPVRINPDLAVAWSASSTQKGLFLDPGLPEVRDLIIDGIAEIITKYDVDGIHFDDYFYPGKDFNDSDSFEKYGGDLELDDWRRENVNELIRSIQAAIRNHNSENNKNVRWGISPTAIWKNGSDEEPLGIPTTKGQESYHALYADTRRWVEEEWIDYICPQIYWYIGYEIADFKAIFTWWDELCANYDVDLYIGHAAYREFDDESPAWRGEMVRQLDMVEDSETVNGSIFFRYGSLRNSVGLAIRDYYAEKDGVLPREPVVVLDTLSVGFPTGDVTLTGTPSNTPGHNIIGTSIPDIPLYMNGEEVTDRTVEGFFHVFPSLTSGDNVFTFSQEGQEDVTRVITLKAPSGSNPTATPLPPVRNETALDYATVIAGDAWVYKTNSTNDAVGYMLTPGQTDRITATSSNNMVKLSSGVWVRSSAVEIQRKSSAVTNVLNGGTYRTGDDYDYVVWKSTVFPAAVVSYDGEKLRIKFGMHDNPPELALSDNLSDTIFASVRSGSDSGVPYWEFTIKKGVNFEGFYVDYEDNEFRLCLKKRKSLSQGDMPLKNIHILLDAGHGGDASGALGPYGADLPEKELNLINTLKLAERLETLGATVSLTRSTDIAVSLQERVDISREIMPDIFISLHINSISEITNSRNIRGFTVWYYDENTFELTDAVQNIMQFINPGTNRAKVINQANFFVCRPWWSPHILLEASFLSSIDDFVWLIDEKWQDSYADATVEAILEYFSK